MKRKILLGIVVIILLVIPIFIYFFSNFQKKQTYTTISSSEQKTLREKIYSVDKILKDPSNNPLPLKIDQENDNELTISGYVAKNELITKGSIILSLPQKDLSKSILVQAHRSKDTTALIAYLIEGSNKFSPIQIWRAYTINDISPLLTEGKHVIISLPIKSAEGKKLMDIATAEHFIDVSPFTKIILSK